jgi:hypothetical protein
MALTVAQAVMNEVQAILLDPTGVYWPASYLIDAYNIVVTAIIGENPNALTKLMDFVPAAGVDQVLPPDAVQFLLAPSNTAGPAIRQVTAEALQEDDPNWYASPPTTLVRHVIPDKFDPLRFRIHPPNNGSGSIRVQYAAAPDDITSLSDPFTLTEGYRMDVRSGMLGMAYALNTDRQDLPKSQYYFEQMSRTVASKIQAQQALTDRVGTPQTSE